MICLVCSLASSRANTWSTTALHCAFFLSVSTLLRVTAGPEAVPVINKVVIQLEPGSVAIVMYKYTWKSHSQCLHWRGHCVSSEHATWGEDLEWSNIRCKMKAAASVRELVVYVQCLDYRKILSRGESTAQCHPVPQCQSAQLHTSQWPVYKKSYDWLHESRTWPMVGIMWLYIPPWCSEHLVLPPSLLDSQAEWYHRRERSRSMILCKIGKFSPTLTQCCICPLHSLHPA